MTTDIRAALVSAIKGSVKDIKFFYAGYAEKIPAVFHEQVAESALTALSTKLREMGLRIVPVEATEGMTINGCAIPGVSLETGRRMYRAMLTASPDPLATDAPVEQK